uniref:Uncharacterized protein n=1 Tax=Schistosoma haematobium TaxID=6185 RepID=A0A094ZZA6_SCHHA
MRIFTTLGIWSTRLKESTNSLWIPGFLNLKPALSVRFVSVDLNGDDDKEKSLAIYLAAGKQIDNPLPQHTYCLHFLPIIKWYFQSRKKTDIFETASLKLWGLVIQSMNDQYGAQPHNSDVY